VNLRESEEGVKKTTTTTLRSEREGDEGGKYRNKMETSNGIGNTYARTAPRPTGVGCCILSVLVQSNATFVVR